MRAITFHIYRGTLNNEVTVAPNTSINNQAVDSSGKLVIYNVSDNESFQIRTEYDTANIQLVKIGVLNEIWVYFHESQIETINCFVMRLLDDGTGTGHQTWQRDPVHPVTATVNGSTGEYAPNNSEREANIPVGNYKSVMLEFYAPPNQTQTQVKVESASKKVPHIGVSIDDIGGGGGNPLKP